MALSQTCFILYIFDQEGRSSGSVRSISVRVKVKTGLLLRHYQVKTGISGRSRDASSQDKLGHTKHRVVTVHNPQLSEHL